MLRSRDRVIGSFSDIELFSKLTTHKSKLQIALSRERSIVEQNGKRIRTQRSEIDLDTKFGDDRTSLKFFPSPPLKNPMSEKLQLALSRERSIVEQNGKRIRTQRSVIVLDTKFGKDR